PRAVIASLNGVGIRPVLTGMYGFGGWRSQPRATQDVDVLVRKKDLRKAVRAVLEAFPALRVQETPPATHLIDPALEDVVIDIIKPRRQLAFVFRYTIPIGDTHDIPDLETALVSKFAVMVAANRDRIAKVQDIVDFMEMVLQNRNRINLAKLERLADKVHL